MINVNDYKGRQMTYAERQEETVRVLQYFVNKQAAAKAAPVPTFVEKKKPVVEEIDETHYTDTQPGDL
jgi:hypothetical protein